MAEVDRFATCRCDACQEIRRLRQENERLRKALDAVTQQ